MVFHPKMLDFLKINDKHYIVDIQRTTSQVESVEDGGDNAAVAIQFSLFDMAQLWCETVSVEDLIEREKKSDSIIQYNAEIVNETILARKADDFNIRFVEDDDSNMCLSLKYYVATYPVTFNLKLEVASPEELSRHILLPLWRTLLILFEENCALRDTIIKKDIEIEQYKVEGAVLKRSLVATNKFDEQKFAENCLLSAPDEGLKVRELIRSKDRRTNLMKLLKIKSKDPLQGASPIKTSSIGKIQVSPIKKSPGRRIRGVETICTKQRMPKPIPESSQPLRRLKLDATNEEDDKESVLDDIQANSNTSCLNDTSGRAKIRKITKL